MDEVIRLFNEGRFQAATIVASAVFACSCSSTSGNDTDASVADTGSDSEVANDSDTHTTDTGTNTETETESCIDRDAGIDKSKCEEIGVEADCDCGWCRIPAGKFTYGSPRGEPCRGVAWNETQVEVTLTHPFLISQTEVTQGQWERLGLANPTKGPMSPDIPANFTSWYEAAAYCNALSKKERLDECYDLSSCTGKIGTQCPDGEFYDFGCYNVQGTLDIIPGLFTCEGEVHKYPNYYECPGYRLPTSAEWEYAARAGTATTTYNGNFTSEWLEPCGKDHEVFEQLDEIAWYCANQKVPRSLEQPMPVGLKKPNCWGLYDVIGNMMEWTDFVKTGHPLEEDEGKSGPLTDPIGTREAGFMAVRGGDFHSTYCVIRVASHFSGPPASKGVGTGFRPVRTLFE